MSARILEDPIRINYCLVGTREWLRASIPECDRHKYKYMVVGRPSDVDPLYHYLNRQIQLGWDTETTGDPNRPKDGLHAHSLTNRMILFQVGTPEFVALVQPELLLWCGHFKAVMENPNILKIGQNVVFDFKEVLAKVNIHPMNLRCTMLAEQVRTAGLRGIQADLKSLVRRYPPHRTISKEVRDEFITFSGQFTEKQLYYAARDVVLLFGFVNQQAERLRVIKSNGDVVPLEKIAQMEFRIIPVTAEMELGGMELNEPILRQNMEYNQRKADKTSDDIHKLFNDELSRRCTGQPQGLYQEGPRWVTINLASAPDKKAALARIGINVGSTDSEELEALDHPIGPKMAEWMNYMKNVTTYGQRLLDMVHPDTKRFHPRFLQLGEGEATEMDKANSGSNSEKGTTATGRFTSNAQQFPKEKKVYDIVQDSAKLTVLRSHFASRISELRAKQAEVCQAKAA